VVTIATFIRSLEAFEIEQIIGIPAGIYVYGTRIYDLVRWDPPLYSQAMALSTIFLFVLFGAVLLYQRSSRHHEFATVRPGGASFRPALIGKWRYFASGWLILWIAVSIYLPLAMVLIGSFMKFFGMFGIEKPFTIQHWAAVLGDPAALAEAKGARTTDDELVDKLSTGVQARRGRVRAAELTPGVSAVLVLVNVELGEAPETMRQTLQGGKGKALLQEGLKALGAHLLKELIR